MREIEKLLTEQTNPASASIDTLPTEEALRIINQEDRSVADAVGRELPAIARAVDAIVAAFERGGRLFYIGAGTSGRLGVLDGSECPPTFGVAAPRGIKNTGSYRPTRNGPVVTAGGSFSSPRPLTAPCMHTTRTLG